MDLPFQRLKAAILVCGNNPRRCFKAAVSPDALAETSKDILDAIKICKNFHQAITQANASESIHRAFEIHPDLPNRHLTSCLVWQISDWALSHM